MPLEFSWRKLTIIASAALVLILVFVLNEDDPPTASTESVGFVPSVTVTPLPVAQYNTVVPYNLPGDSSPTSALVMIQGLADHRLVIWSLTGEDEPQEVDRHVSMWPLLPDPTDSRVLYSTKGTMMVLDVRDQRADIVGELPDGGVVSLAQWSPDGRAVAYVVNTQGHDIAYYTLADGSRKAVEMKRVTRGLALDVAWLEDSRPVTISMGVGPVGGLEAYYELYDPVTSSQVLIPPDTPVLQPWTPWRSPDGSQQLFLPNSSDVHISSCKTGVLAVTGSEWLHLTAIMDISNYETAFRIDNVVLDRMSWLRDGRVLMRGMAEEACAPKANGLYVARLHEKPQQIVSSQVAYTKQDSEGVVVSIPYALSPDQKLVAWAENDLSSETSTVYLTPLAGGEGEYLFQTGSPDPAIPFDFQDRLMILHFVWLR